MNAERIRRRIRSHPALFGELGEAKERQAERILQKTTERLRPHWDERAAQVQHAAGQRLLRAYA